MNRIDAFPEESPTKPTANVRTATLATLARISRLAELAAERLAVGPDESAVAGALADLVQIRALARGAST